MKKEMLNCHPHGVGKFSNHGFLVTKSHGNRVVLVWIMSCDAQPRRGTHQEPGATCTEWLHLFNLCAVAPELAEMYGLIKRPVIVPPVNPWGS